jgi:hypothetical protein
MFQRLGGMQPAKATPNNNHVLMLIVGLYFH